jgi:hypothetical protein
VCTKKCSVFHLAVFRLENNKGILSNCIPIKTEEHFCFYRCFEQGTKKKSTTICGLF